MSSIREFKDTLITEINAYCGRPVIEAEQSGDKPEGSHATFKITSPYIKGVGQAEEVGRQVGETFQLVRTESFTRVLSFSAYDMDEDVSYELAQQIHDWFDFQGYEFLSRNNIVVVEKTSVQNRDLFLFEDYERRNGFDVTLRLTRLLVSSGVDYFDRTDMFDNSEANYTMAMELSLHHYRTSHPLPMTGMMRIGQQTIS